MLDTAGTSVTKPQWGVPTSKMFRLLVFYTLRLTMGIFNALTVVGNLFASYVYHLGDLGIAAITPGGAVMLASAVAACLMVVSAISKVVLGALSDRTLVGAIALACVCGALSILSILWGVPVSVVFVYLAGLLCGGLYAAINALGLSVTR